MLDAARCRQSLFLCRAQLTLLSFHRWWRTHDLDDAQPYLGMQEAQLASLESPSSLSSLFSGSLPPRVPGSQLTMPKTLVPSSLRAQDWSLKFLHLATSLVWHCRDQQDFNVKLNESCCSMLPQVQLNLECLKADEALEWTLFSEAAAYASHLHDFLHRGVELPIVAEVVSSSSADSVRV